ncbi:RNA polymerase sigma factor [Agriterribacter sp.]|uniref:RNA polymerase sigma factor n=1 Tax=Agriterribacter sp. TaxID=2821509 RepID=UPI002C96AFCB|nr:RNA polymerase sigma factor [Agriterribacter sp.]HTN07893.1 RNA polymerase sigma factor [Agriterribacter sp.]
MDDLTTLPLSQLSDTELVSRVLSGEKHLFEWIMRRYNQRLFRAGISILGDDMEVEDAMQNAYIKAYQHLDKFEYRASLSTWLIKILINECLAQKNKKAHLKSVNIECHPENMGSMKTPSNILMNKEMGIALETAIAHLPEKYRLVFVLREIEGLPVKETGDILGIEEANVKVRLNRAKAMLRQSLSNDMKEHVYTFHLTRCDRLVNHVLNAIA